MALFRASPTLARCSSRVPFFSNTLVTTSTSTFIRRPRPFGANHIRHKHSQLESDLQAEDWSKAFNSAGYRRAIYATALVVIGTLAYNTVSLRINSDGFMPCELVAKEPVSPTASIFYLDPDPNSAKYPNRLHEIFASECSIFDYPKMAWKTNNAKKLRDAWKEGIMWSLEFKQPQLQIVRHYTPLPPSAVDEEGRKGCVKFLIREEPRGEMSSYLHNLKVTDAVSDKTKTESVGVLKTFFMAIDDMIHLRPPPKLVDRNAGKTTLDVRGPNHDFYPGQGVRQIVYFAGGTGIAPVLQTAHALLGSHKANRMVDPADLATRKLHIFWANRTRSDCLGGYSDPVPELLHTDQQSLSQSQGAGFWTKLGFGAESKSVATETVSTAAPSPSLPASEKQHTPHEANLIVRELEALKDKYPGQVTVEYFVDEENTWIDKNVVSRALVRLKDGEISDTQNSMSSGRRQVMVSGPPGFIAYLAGPKVWYHGMEQQGPLGGLILGSLSSAPQNVRVWKI